LQASLGDDYDKIKLLQEWFGYCLTSDTSLQKMMFLRGPPAAGKGIIVDTLCQLVGENQAAATSFSELSGSFGVQSLMDKLVCVIPDARTPRFGDNVRGLELLLNIASGDGIQVNRKFKDPIERQKLVARITIASNEFLDVPDHSGAMLRRLNIVEFCRSFAANPDPSLRRRIDSEVQGVAVWATEGLRRLRDQGHFTVPASSEAAKQEWRTQTSPLAEFLEQCTDVDPQGEVAKAELFDAWEKWARERHSIRPISFSRFVERLRSNAPYAMSDSYEKGGHKFCVYRGLTMKAWAAKHYLGVIR
jgi:putative DNA primase/helicase